MIELAPIDQVSALHPPPPDGARLRVAVICAGNQGPGWLADLYQRLHACAFAQTDWFVTDPPTTPTLRAPATPIRDLLLRLDRLALGALAPILAPVPLHPEQAARALRVTTDADGRSTLGAEDLETLRALQPDLLILIGLAPAAGTLALLARHGTWTLERSASDPDCSGLWMFSEFLRTQDAVHSGVLVHDSMRDAWGLLEPGHCSPTRTNFSRHRAYQLQKVPAKLIDALRRLAARRQSRWLDYRPRPEPSAAAILRYWLHAVPPILRQLRMHLLHTERWFVAVRRAPALLDPQAPDGGWDSYSRLQPPADRFWADPCPWNEAGADYVFVESLRDSRGRAEIAAIELAADGRIASVRDVLQLPTHLSYPFLFRWQDRTYMLVESATAGRVPIFIADQFPERWRHAGDALSGVRAVDATLHRDGDTWWMFACVADSAFDDGGREWDDLYLFHSVSPLGPWLPHPENPIVSDVRRARPAGPLFRDGGRLIRPGQDCAGEYGRAVVFNEVTQLDRLHYRECPIGTLNPDWAPDLRGCHLYARLGDMEVIDAKLLVRNGMRKHSPQ